MKNGFTAGMGRKGNGLFDEFSADCDFGGNRHLLHNPSPIYTDTAGWIGRSGGCLEIQSEGRKA